MKINKHYEKTIGGSQEDFIEFIKNNNKNIEKEDLSDIDFLIQRIAQNLFYYEDNISTAKSDYISLIGLLMKKGVIFEGDKVFKNVGGPPEPPKSRIIKEPW